MNEIIFNIFKSLYYSIFIYITYKDILWIIQPTTEQRKYDTATKLSERYKKVKYENYSELYKRLSWEVFPHTIFKLVWVIIGCFTFNSKLFIGYAIFGMVHSIINIILRKKYDTTRIQLNWLDSVIGVMVFSFAFINTYFLKINIF